MTTQAAQVQNLILQGYDAIAIDAASPDALNGAVKAACDAHIAVVSFDGIVTAALRLSHRHRLQDRWASEQVDYLATRFPKGGNLLEIRGLAGTSIDNVIHEGIARRCRSPSAIQDRRQRRGRLGRGDGAEGRRQRAVLLPAGGRRRRSGRRRLWRRAGLSAAAGRPEPIIIMGNRQDELAWWKQQHDKNGYTTWSATHRARHFLASAMGDAAGSGRQDGAA